MAPKERLFAASQKKLILMCGLPGAGKTTTAHRIRQALGDAFVVSRDRIRNRYRENALYDESSKWEITPIDYIFYDDVERFLPFYNTIILDATFKIFHKRRKAFDFAHKHGCQLVMIECVCSHETILERLTHQMSLKYKKFNVPPKDILEYYAKSMEPQKELEDASFLQFDTETNHVIVKSLQEHSCRFAEQLVEILKQPFDPSLLEPFCAIPYYQNGWIEEYEKDSI